MNVRSNKILAIAVFLFIGLSASAQWTCRSKLGANLKPLKKDFPLLWASEVTWGEGMMNDRHIRNAMFFVGADYTIKKKHKFYLEGGIKSWYNSLGSPEDLKQPFFKTKPGLREAFYRHKQKNMNFILGLHSMKLDDYFLVNERGIGISYRHNIDNYKLNVGIATVGKDFSRFGSFCSVHYLYNLIRDRDLAYLGNEPFQTNFGAFILTWTPPKKSSGSEFESDDEFGEFDEEPKKEILKEAGVIYYQEFGEWIEDIPVYYGAFGKLELLGMELRLEALNHTKVDNDAVIYHAKLSRMLTWDSGSRTIFAAGYFGKYDIDENAKVFPSYSNLFAGEVLRMDVVDMPLIQVSAKHNFPKYKIHFKGQMVTQFEGEDFREYNFAFGKTFKKHFKLTFMFSRIEANPLNEIFYMGRGELRITF